jgi:Rrf2 family protein
MISLSVDYALRAVVTIARHHGAPCTAPQIAKATQIPAPYLSKLMQRLVHEGLVHSRRGIHGGFLLASVPTKMTIWDVVVAVESISRIRRCPTGIGSRGQLCLLHRRLDLAIQMLEDQLRGTTIADLLDESGPISPLCVGAALPGKQSDNGANKQTKPP